MVAPIDDSCRTYVLLSSLDETVVQHDQTFNLALHRFKGVYEPRGHKYITDFEYTPTPTITYRVGGVILKKEMLWIHKRTQLMIRYTLVDAHSETRLRLRPFLAFRDKHALTHANMEADGHSYPAANGVKCRLYNSFPWLYLQTSKPGTEFVPAPDWYYGFEYQQELARGYEGYEDLLTTGYFEAELKKGESIIFSASLDEMGSTKTIEEVFAASIARRTHKIDFISCLEHSARQFLIRRPGDRTEVVSGYPWHGVSGRQTFISLPGITLEQGHKEDCIDALDTLVREMRDGMFTGSASAEVAADAPLWFFWTLQQLEREVGAKEIWASYGPAMKDILESYRQGIGGRVALHDNGLIWASSEEVPLTWMNSTIDGRPVTPRNGYQVEVNALWYNAVCYALELAGKYGDKTDKAFVKAWASLPARTQESFIELFRLPEGYLADFVDGSGPDKSTRPNMIVACGLNYKMLDETMQLEVIRTVRQHLLTPKGLRTLSPQNPLYRGSQEGMPAERDFAAKNGSVWPWLPPLHIHDLMEGQLGGLAQEGGVPLGPPRAEGAEGPLRHGLALHPLQLPHLGSAGDVEDGGGGLREGQRPLDGHELFEGSGPPHPCQRDRLLLDAALAEGRDDLGGQLGVDAHHQPVGPPHLDAAGVDSPAVEVFGLALDAGRPRGGPEAGQLEGLGEGQLLLGLAQARPLFALIIDGAAQIPFQRQPPGGQLLLQHHRLREALDDALHRRQIVRDEKFGLKG